MREFPDHSTTALRMKMTSPKEKLNELSSLISDDRLRSTVDVILSNEDFFKFPASTHLHHAYVGGLCTHTIEVTTLAIRLLEMHPKANADVVIAGCLWHDFAKIWDYKLVTYFKSSDAEKPFGDLPRRYVLAEGHEAYKKVYQADFDYKDKVHHISGSMAEFTSAANDMEVNRGLIQEVQHAILAHHGRKEWGTVKEPQTLEAWLLHTADYSSAHYGQAKEKPLT